MNRLDTILREKYSMTNMLILIAFTKLKIEAVLQTCFRSYRIYNSFQVRPPQ
jgi:hypothetical protein